MIKTINVNDGFYKTISYDVDKLKEIMMEVYNKQHCVTKVREVGYAKSYEELEQNLNKAKIFGNNIYKNIEEIVKIEELVKNSQYFSEESYKKFHMIVKKDVYPEVVDYMNILVTSDDDKILLKAYMMMISNIYEYEPIIEAMDNLCNGIEKHIDAYLYLFRSARYKWDRGTAIDFYPFFNYKEIREASYNVCRLFDEEMCSKEEIHKCLTKAFTVPKKGN